VKKVLITGAHGLLGQKISLILARESDAEILMTDIQRTTPFDVPRFDYHQLDVTRLGDVKSLVASYRPDVIINTAAKTDVDDCEIQRQEAWCVNVDSVKHLVIAARKLERCRIIHISTDYVFSGEEGMYSEDSRPNPVNYYGKSKLAAENVLRAGGVDHLIVRTQLLYGTGVNIRKNFVLWTLAMLKQGKPFGVVDDQVGNPTLVDDLAFAILKLAETSTEGLYHVAGSEAVSRYDWARAIAMVFGLDPDVIYPIRTAELHQSARRPMNSTFVTLKFESEFGFGLSNIQQGLERFRSQLQQGARLFQMLNRSN